MRLLLTNDDGIDAPGLAALKVAARGLGDLVVVAPSGPQSGCGHVVTTHRPVEWTERGDEFAVAGTPADCVRLALHHLAGDVDWVLSGINAGGNLGADVYLSGTVAAAREAAFHGLPAIAVSQYVAKGREIDWDEAARLAAGVVRDLMARPLEPGAFWGVNLPHPVVVDGWVECPLDPSPLPLTYAVEPGRATYAGVYHDRKRRPGGDVDVCFSGRIAVTRLAIGGGAPVAAPADPHA